MWAFLVCVFLTVFFLYLQKRGRKNGKKNFWEERGFPTLSPRIALWELITGWTGNFDADPDYYLDVKKKREKFAGLMEFGTPVLFVNDLDLARDIFVKDFDHFFDRRDFARSDPLLSEVLFFQQGEIWKSVRSTLSPTFTSGRIRRMYPHFLKSANNLKNWVEENSGEVNLSDAMRRYTIQVIAGCAFGMDVNVFTEGDSEVAEMSEAVARIGLMRKIRFGIISFFPRVAEFFKIQNLDAKPAKYFDEVLTRAIREREANDDPTNRHDDFLQLLLEAKKGGMKIDLNELSKDELEGLVQETEGKKVVWTESLVKAQAFLFLFAGFDGVSNNLSVCLAVLAEHPEIQDRLFEELQDKEVTYDNVNSLEYMEKFLSEVLRLYPLARLERKCVKDYKIKGTDLVIPKDSMVCFVMEGIHRDGDHYPDPLTFDPERFSPEVKATRHPYAYMPFGVGPRNCLAMRFALVEAKAILAQIVKNFEVKASSEKVEGPAIRRVAFGYRADPKLRIRFIPRT